MKSSSTTPLRFEQVAQPGVVISNAWPQSRMTEGATLKAIEEVLAKFPFFEAYQTVDIPYAAERRAVRRLLGDRGRPHTYALTRVLAEKKASLSSLDSANRRLAVETVIAQFAAAEEAGASTITVISGPRPTDPALRPEALKVLEDSLTQLAAAIVAHPRLELLIEPLDYEAHKRNTLGTTSEAVAICRRLAAKRLKLVLCLDTAHMILNGEDTVAAVAEAREFITEFHFCNPVKDRSSPHYGDQHVPFGAPGVVDLPEIAAFMAGLQLGGYLAAAVRPRVYCEVMSSAAMGPLAVVEHCQAALLIAWARANEPAA
ncbi:MAG TPA: TIM barrel protein [Lacunisphaera sp.]|nr:TIM barrel protein [Lacunisphaera sp.]